jgi:hypothetical protein
MADDRKAVGGGCLTHTLYVWPAHEVIAQSAYWTSRWHEAFERVARRLGEGVACCVLGGLPVCPEPIPMELLPTGKLIFTVHVSGTSIHVVIWDFEGPEDPGPDAPGPNGGVRRTADGLVLGLRGTGKDFSIATFYGPMRPIPLGSMVPLPPSMMRVAMGRHAGRSWRAHWLPSRVSVASDVAANTRIAPAETVRASRSTRRVLASCPKLTTAGAATDGQLLFARKRPVAAVRLGANAEIPRTDWLKYRTSGIRVLSPFKHVKSEQSFVFSNSEVEKAIIGSQLFSGCQLSKGGASLSPH